MGLLFGLFIRSSYAASRTIPFNPTPDPWTSVRIFRSSTKKSRSRVARLIVRVMDANKYSYEIPFIDDGSKDRPE